MLLVLVQGQNEGKSNIATTIVVIYLFSGKIRA